MYAAVRDIANKLLAARSAGQVRQKWPANFFRRTDSLKTQFNQAYNRQQALCKDPVLIRSQFKLIEHTKANYSIYNKHVYNFNKAGFIIGKIITQLVITGLERRGRLKAIQPGNCKQVTVIAVISAASWTIPLFIIFASQHHLSTQYKEAAILRNWAIAVSNNSWTNNGLGVKWLKHFIKHTECKVVGARRLLILNSHKSHHSLKFKQLCKEHNIYTLCMPPYSSHLLQLLNVGCFSLLKRAYSCKIKALICNYINYITKLKFLPAFKAAFNSAFILANISLAF